MSKLSSFQEGSPAENVFSADFSRPHTKKNHMFLSPWWRKQKNLHALYYYFFSHNNLSFALMRLLLRRYSTVPSGTAQKIKNNKTTTTTQSVRANMNKSHHVWLSHLLSSEVNRENCPCCWYILSYRQSKRVHMSEIYCFLKKKFSPNISTWYDNYFLNNRPDRIRRNIKLPFWNFFIDFSPPQNRFQMSWFYFIFFKFCFSIKCAFFCLFVSLPCYNGHNA